MQRGATTDRDLARDSRTDSDYCTEVIGQVLVHAQPFRPTISDLTVLSTTNIQCTDVRGHSIPMWTRWEGGSKMSVFVLAQGIKTVHAGGHTASIWRLRWQF